MLAGTGLGNDTLGAEPLGEQRLADGVVDLVRSRVCKVFSLEPDLGAPELGKSRRVRQRRRPAHPFTELPAKFFLEFLVRQKLLDASFESFERRHQCLRNVAAAERPEATAIVR